MTHAYGPSALQARCGAPNVYCSVYAREVTCAACQRLRDGDRLHENDRLAPPSVRLLTAKPVRKRKP